MPTETIIAISVGGAGIVLALLGILLAAMAKASGRRNERLMQALQQTTAQAESAQWMRTRELDAVVKRQTRALLSIKTLKDAINACLRTGDEKLDAEEAIKGVSDAGRHLVTLYEKIHSELGRIDRAALHRARAVAHDALHQTRTALESNPARVAEDDRTALLRTRTELTELQDTIRDSRTEQMVRWATVQPEE